MTSFITPLSDRALVSVTGSDATHFLQGLLTCNMEKITPETPAYGLLLTPQGKFLFDLFVIKTPNGFLLDCAATRMDALISRLSMYKLRADVAIGPDPTGFSVYALWGGDVPAVGFTDPRHPEMGVRLLTSGAVPAATPALLADYHRHRVNLGIPDGYYDLTPEKSFPMEFGLEDLHAIDFAKGCYVGQEVTARMKHRLVVRKSIYKITSKAGPLPDAGAPILLGDAIMGHVTSVHTTLALAQLRHEDVARAQADGLFFLADDVACVAQMPEWRTMDASVLDETPS